MSLVRTAPTPSRRTAIGSRIRELRLTKKLRQVDLAEQAGISWRHLIRMEKGEGGDPKRETLDRIAAALGVDTSELTGEDDEEADSMPDLDVVLRSYLEKLIREVAQA